MTCAIEIEPTVLGRPIKDENLLGYQQGFVNHYHEKIEVAVAGLICIHHVQLPALENKYVDGRWVIELSACCKEHLDLVEKRLDEIFK
jgi:hypothetical protein